MQPADIIIKQGDLETIVEEAEEFTIADYSLVPETRYDLDANMINQMGRKS